MSKQESTCDQFIRMAGKLVDELGGKGVVSGPISIMQMPHESREHFYVAVKIFGKKPTKVIP